MLGSHDNKRNMNNTTQAFEYRINERSHQALTPRHMQLRARRYAAHGNDEIQLDLSIRIIDRENDPLSILLPPKLERR